MDKDQVVKDSRARMQKALDLLRVELTKIRTGRASLGILEDVRVDYYGTATPLNQVATLNIPDPKLITIQPWEPNMVPVIEKALLKASLGLNPNSDGKIIRLPIPPLNEERRRELSKHIKKMGEDDKVAVRNIRRDANEELKRLEKLEHVSEDEVKKAQEDVQKMTDDFIKKIDETISHKEKEIMTV